MESLRHSVRRSRRELLPWDAARAALGDPFGEGEGLGEAFGVDFGEGFAVGLGVTVGFGVGLWRRELPWAWESLSAWPGRGFGVGSSGIVSSSGDRLWCWRRRWLRYLRRGFGRRRRRLGRRAEALAQESVRALTLRVGSWAASGCSEHPPERSVKTSPHPTRRYLRRSAALPCARNTEAPQSAGYEKRQRKEDSSGNAGHP